MVTPDMAPVSPLALMSQGLTDIVRERINNRTLIEDCQPLDPAIRIERLSAWYGNRQHPVITDITLPIDENRITAFIGPSGCGKSTLLRCLNRIHETTPHAGSSGEVLLKGVGNIYNPRTDLTALRRRLGMVFQKPVTFIGNIVDDVTSGWKLWFKGNKYEIAEQYLTQVRLWDEVKDRLDKPSALLSGGQQQRLCLARNLALKPEILLLDEPCSALDPPNTFMIEDLMLELKKTKTIVLVTHHMKQAGRVADYVVFLCNGRQEGSPGQIVECGSTSQVLVNPKDKRTEEYVTGRFG